MPRTWHGGFFRPGPPLHASEAEAALGRGPVGAPQSSGAVLGRPVSMALGQGRAVGCQETPPRQAPRKGSGTLCPGYANRAFTTGLLISTRGRATWDWRLQSPPGVVTWVSGTRAQTSGPLLWLYALLSAPGPAAPPVPLQTPPLLPGDGQWCEDLVGDSGQKVDGPPWG